MKDDIIAHLQDARQLEKLYRGDKTGFKREFGELYSQLKGNAIADFWNERLNYESDEINWGSGKELIFVIIAAFIAGLIAKIPAIFSVNEEFFYPRNIGFIVFPALMTYFAWKNNLAIAKIALIAAFSLIGLVFINVAFPDVKETDTMVLSCIHLVLFLWALLGFTFVEGKINSVDKRLDYLKYNGDLIVITALILISGGIMSGLTVNLFQVIGLDIVPFYSKYVVVFGLAAVPLVGTYLTQTNPQLVGKVSPVIARIFSPLVLVMLVIYLVAMFFSGKDPYTDREFLLIFNALLVGVMAIIFFSVAESSKTTKSKAEIWVLLLLSAVTIVVNSIALSAILFRISEWGITPNRAAVLGGNMLILINLLLVTAKLFKVVSKKADLGEVGKTISSFLPIYTLWTVIVTFLFPFIFGFK
ncbi:hypothetical protein [Dyadobacter sp. CY312]|uniref:hypothetical protein n=1 Tax=Dyadobacter sp. CY312 TaxID=2907303 RepID=UPI001F2037CB|nr:hypothetical protein [Dyadobacter sp. CY312]MCE7039616.1 hypothetical protein [Dyadobacter sp. CY312]